MAKGKQSSMSDLHSELPEQFKLTLPAVNLPGFPEAEQLQGDYILSRISAPSQRPTWQILFPPIVGYQRLVLRAIEESADHWSFGLSLRGGPDAVFWKGSFSGVSIQKISAELQFAEVLEGDWPTTLAIEASRPSAPDHSLASISTLGTVDCECLSAGFGKMELVILGVTEGDCTCPVPCVHCDGFESLPQLEQLVNVTCYWYLILAASQAICPWGLAYDEFDVELTTDDCTASFVLRVWAGSWLSAQFDVTIPLERFDISNVPPLQLDPSVGWDDPAGSCDGSNSTAYIKLIRTAFPGCEDCGNIWGTCKVEMIPLPVLNPACEIKVPCCPCDCAPDTFDIPGITCSETCVSGDCPPSIDLTRATVSFTLSAPDAGSGGIAGGYSFHTLPECSSDENQVRSIVDEFVAFSETDRTAHVFKCDGSTLKYVCRDPSSGAYQSLGRNKNKLKLNSDGTHTEIQGNYDEDMEYNFDSQGHIFRIVKTCPAPEPNSLLLSSAQTSIWTIAHDTGTSHVTDPFSRRFTTTYDSNGNPKRIEDPYNRLTSFVFDSSGLPTMKISPELCTTELRYDTDRRLTTYIAPNGTRVSYAYDGQGMVSGVQYPSQGRYTFQYLGNTTTQVTDPVGAVTTVLFDANRSIRAVVNPLGQRTSYQYEREAFSAIERPLQGRTSYIYKTLPQNVRALEVEITPSGRTTNVYSGNTFVATINPLGGRTTYVRSTGERLIAQIDPLGNRTSYLYNAAGKLQATIDPLGNRTSTTYNSLAQVQSTINPLGGADRGL